MPSLFELGSPMSLTDVCGELKRRLATRGYNQEPSFPKMADQIMVDHPECHALVISGDLAIDGDLDLDSLLEHRISTLAVLGHLSVEGRIINESGDSGPFLCVDGNVTAGQVIKGASSLMIFGSIAAREIIFCDYSHGAFIVGRDVTAPAIITNNQIIEAGGEVAGIVIGDEHANMRELLLPEVFEDPGDLQDEWPVGDIIRERLAAGLPILKSAA